MSKVYEQRKFDSEIYKSLRRGWRKMDTKLLFASIVFLVGLGFVILSPFSHKVSHWVEKPRNAFFIVVLSIFTGAISLVQLTDLEHTLHLTEHHLRDMMLLISIVWASLACAEYIRIRGDIIARPIAVALFGLLAYPIASVGTTGLSAVFLGVLLAQSLKERENTIPSILYFSWVGCNLAGGGSSLGDGPEILLPSRGVPFMWPTENLLFGNGLIGIMITLVYLVWDTFHWNKEDHSDDIAAYQVPIIDLAQSWPYMVLLMGIPASFFVTPGGWSQIIMLIAVGFAAVGIARITRSKSDEEELFKKNGDNHHWWSPVIELTVVLSILFFFSAALNLVLEEEPEVLANVGVDTPQEFYWVSTFSSAFLDNAPVSVLLLEAAHAQHEAHILNDDTELVEGLEIPHDSVVAVINGAIHGGALSKLGNFAQIVFLMMCARILGKNRTPGYFTYLKYSVLFLLPVLIVAYFLGITL